MNFIREVSPRRSIWAFFGALALATTAFVVGPTLMPSTSQVQTLPAADAAGSVGTGLVLTTVAGSAPGTGVVTGTRGYAIGMTFPLQLEIIAGPGEFAGGGNKVAFDLMGAAGTQAFSVTYRCVDSSTTLAVVDGNGSPYGETITSNLAVSPGTCGEVTPPPIALPQPNVHVAACVNNAAAPGTVTVAATPNVTVNGATGAFSASGYGQMTLVYQATGNNTFVGGKATVNLTVNLGDKPNCAPVPPKDSDGDGVPDSIDKCPGTPAGEKVDANGCVTSLPPEVKLTDTKNASKDKDGTATFNVTNRNQVDITYQVNVSDGSSQSVTVPKDTTVSFSVNRPQGDYKLSLRAAGSVSNPVSFSIGFDKVPVVTSKPQPKPSSHVTTPAPTKAVGVIGQQPTQSTNAQPRINKIVAETAVHDSAAVSSSGWLWSAGLLGLIGLLLFMPNLRKKGRRA